MMRVPSPVSTMELISRMPMYVLHDQLTPLVAHSLVNVFNKGVFCYTMFLFA